MREQWYKKYQPKTLNDYVFKDIEQKGMIYKWVEDGIMPDIMLSGIQGSGKTSLALVLLNEMKVHPADTLFINASKDNGVDYIREKVSNFIDMCPFGEFRCVVMDEADRLSASAQDALKGIMGSSDSGARFIFTCNDPQRIIAPLHSRLQTLTFKALDKVEFKARLAEILLSEGVEFPSLELLDSYMNLTYPDMRKCINLCEQNSHTGTLTPPLEDDGSVEDYILIMADLFKSGKFKEAREIICKQIPPDGFENIYKFFYQNLDLWGDTEDQQDEALLIIRNALVNNMSCDQEINLSATIVELKNIRNQK